uniref:C2 domain-containing protein n=1 Tax=Glossina brevipalpis TaxID=37001 RepID=A0A1A9WU59_9MUSC
MKNLKCLLSYKTRFDNNDVRTYNAFTSNGGNDKRISSLSPPYEKNMKEHKRTMVPSIHKPLHKLNEMKLKRKTDKISLNARQPEIQSKSVATSISTPPTAVARATAATLTSNRGNNRINYNSLNRIRNSTSSCCTSQSMQLKSDYTTNGKWRRWLHYCRQSINKRKSKHFFSILLKRCCCCQWCRFCCFNLIKSGSLNKTDEYNHNDDDDDDIEAKVTAYLNEMKVKNSAITTKTTQDTMIDSTTSRRSIETYDMITFPTRNESIDKIITCSTTTTNTSIIPIATTTTTTTIATITTATTTATTTTTITTTTNSSDSAIINTFNSTNNYYPKVIQRSHSQRLFRTQTNKRTWTWDDSLRSNSDRFLETLEEDSSFINDFIIINSPTNTIITNVIATHNSQGNINALMPSRSSLPFMFLAANEEDNDFVIIKEEEAKAAAEELNRSPVMDHSRIDPSASPLQSRGSGSSDAWHGQSDEDIDRLVAMHQNRSSLSSLGLRSDSMASVYSGAGEGRYGTVVVKGQVEFGMQYNYKLAALEIHVVRCKDLAAVDSKRNRSDPYVKVYLLPDKSKAGKRKTKVKKHTLNPIFDEVLRFHMPIASLEARTLWLTVWHSDMFGRNDFLGEVSVNLQGRVFDNPQSQWYLLQERSEPFDEVATYRGDIVIGLKYVTPESTKSTFMRSGSIVSGMGSGLKKFGSIKSVATSKSERTAKGGQLHVLVKEAKHLTPIKPNGCCDAFCKSYLLPDRTRSSKQKTPVVKRSNNPSWNYTFIYEDVSLEDLSERALELTVWDHDRLASNEFLGGVRFSLGTGKSYGRQVDWMDASGKELSLWQNMLDRPNFWVEGSLVLRSTLDGIRITP